MDGVRSGGAQQPAPTFTRLDTDGYHQAGRTNSPANAPQVGLSGAAFGGGLSFHTGWKIQGFPADELQLMRGLAKQPGTSMETLLGFARDASSGVRQLGYVDLPRYAHTQMTEALEGAAGMRVAMMVKERVAERLTEFSGELGALQGDKEAIRRLLGHAAASNVSAGTFDGILASLGVPQNQRGNLSLELQRLHHDTPRLARFMAGQEAGMGNIVDVVHAGIPDARRAVAALQTELAKPSVDIRSFLTSSEVGGIRAQVMAELPAEQRAGAQASARKLAQSYRAVETTETVVKTGAQLLSGCLSGPTAWAMTAVFAVSSVASAHTAYNVNARADVMMGAGVADARHGASSEVALLGAVVGALPVPDVVSYADFGVKTGVALAATIDALMGGDF